MSNTLTAVSNLRTQYEQSQGWFQGTMQGVTDDVAYYQPDGLPTPIASHAAHVLMGLDFLILGQVAGQQPLMMSSFAGKTGVSEPPPAGGDWRDWGRGVKVDLSQLNDYGSAVFAAIDEYLASLSDQDLARQLESGPFANNSVAFAFNTMLLNTYCHSGEISCLKGLKSLKGYPV